MKKCSQCKVEKKFEEFYKNKGHKNGLRSECKVCSKKYEARPEIRERIRKSRKEYYAKPENKEKMKERSREYHNRYTIDRIYKKYKYNAKKRGIKWNITEQDILNLPKICYLCGDKIKGFRVDRVDNIKGYIKGNIEPCCIICNRVKMAYTKEFILEHIKKIIKHNN